MAYRLGYTDYSWASQHHISHDGFDTVTKGQFTSSVSYEMLWILHWNKGLTGMQARETRIPPALGADSWLSDTSDDECAPP